MKPCAIFFHGLFFIGDPPVRLPSAFNIVYEQILQLRNSGLWDVASEIHIGINGSQESIPVGKSIFPDKANVTYHGLQSRSENITIVMIEEWVKTHPGWIVLYLHSKGATKSPGTRESRMATAWRTAMMWDLVDGWRQCVHQLTAHDVVCSHWMWEQCDGSQHISPGNFWWATSDFLATLPSILKRERIKTSGLGAEESRFEAEVWIGNGRRPVVKALRSLHIGPTAFLPYWSIQ